MKKPALLLTLALAAAPTAHAAERVPGTWIYYSASSDPITDINTGWVSVDEINDTYGATALTFKCADGAAPGLWAVLLSKNPLFDLGVYNLPDVVVRVGARAPQIIG